MKFNCPNCNEAFNHSGLTSESKVLCPICNTKFFIKDIEVVQEDAAPESAPENSPEELPRPQDSVHAETQATAKNTGGAGKGIVLMFFVALVLFAAYTIFNKTEKKQIEKPLRPMPEMVIMPVISKDHIAPTPILQGGAGTPLNQVFKVGKTYPKPDEAGRPWWPLNGCWPIIQPFDLSKTQAFLTCLPDAEPEHYHGLFALSYRNYDNFSVMQFHGNSLQISGEHSKGGGFRTNIKADPSLVPNKPMLMSFTPTNGKCAVQVNAAPAVFIPSNISAKYFGAAYANRPYFKGKVGELRTYKPLSKKMTAYVKSELAEYWGITGRGAGFVQGYRNAPRLLNRDVLQASSSELTLAIDPTTVPETPFQIFVGRDKQISEVSIADLPANDEVSVRCDTTWHVAAPTDSTPPVYFHFSSDLTKKFASSLGENGFYALLYRKTAEEPFKEVASSIPSTTGSVSFGPISAQTGFYTLGVIQGLPTQSPDFEVLINGKPATGNLTFSPGERINISGKGSESFDIILKESNSGIVWYQGKSDQFNDNFWMIRSGKTPLTLIVKSKPGFIAKKTKFSLGVNDSGFAMYPGLTAQILNLDVDQSVGAKGAFPSPSDMKPHHKSLGTSLSTDPVYANYPAYRTSESALKATPAPGKQGFFRPDYWQMVCAHPSFSRKHDNFFKWQLTTDYPFGDIQKSNRVAVYLTGLIMVEQPGTYVFEARANVSLKMKIAGKETTLVIDAEHDAKEKWPLRATQIKVDLQPGLVPYSMMVNRQSASPADVHVLWKKPGESEFSTLTGSHFLHKVHAPVEQAYQKFTKSAPWRVARPLTPSLKSTPGRSYLANPDLAGKTATTKAFLETCKQLMNTWQNDAELAGSPEVAEAILQLIIEHTNAQRKDKKDGRYRKLIVLGKWAVCNANYLVYYESIRGFLEACMRNPELQSKALEARNAINSYTTRVYSRTFFGESHNGTNDGYNDFHNFLVNSWRSARVIDDPLAFDAARSLYDNHFRYGAGTAPGLQTDNIFDFHSANGRHISQGGYGDNWLSRVINTVNFGSPWGNSREQYRRLAEYVLAYEWFYYKGARSFSFAGRNMSGRGNFGLGFINRFYKFPREILDEETWAKLDEVKARYAKKQLLEGNHFFGRHLIQMHRRKDFYIEVKMAAPGVGGVETFAGAYPGNLSFGDGVTTILKHGDEYKAINAINIPESLWKFRSLPGTTQLNYEWEKLDRYRGWSGSRAGGVSDGEFGHCAFEFTSHKRNATKANKMFTFVEDGMIVMGAGITGSRKASQPYYSYRSNINQCERSGDITIINAKGETITIPAKEIKKTIKLPMNQSYWITHRGIGYLVVPTKTEMGAKSNAVGELVIESSIRTPYNRLQEDIWKGKNMEGYKKQCEALMKRNPPRQANVLTIWIDHGPQPTNATCSYMVCMRPEKAPVSQWLKKPPFTILSNDKNLQAVRDDRQNILHAFFYHPENASVKNEKGETILAAKQPASVMVRPLANGKTSYTVQDPLAAICWQKNEKADVINLTVLKDGKQEEINIQLPGAYDPDDRYKADCITIKSAHPRP